MVRGLLTRALVLPALLGLTVLAQPAEASAVRVCTIQNSTYTFSNFLLLTLLPGGTTGTVSWDESCVRVDTAVLIPGTVAFSHTRVGTWAGNCLVTLFNGTGSSTGFNGVLLAGSVLVTASTPGGNSVASTVQVAIPNAICAETSATALGGLPSGVSVVVAP